MSGTYKVILESVSLQSDLKGIVLAVASILDVDKRKAVEKVKELPLTLASDCNDVQARLMADMLRGMRAEVRIIPPLDALASANAHASPREEPALMAMMEDAVTHRVSWRAMALLGITVVAFVALVVTGGRLLLDHARPTPQKSLQLLQQGKMEDARKSLDRQMGSRPGNVDLQIQKGLYYLGVARQKMDSLAWMAFGGGRSVPDSGQDLMQLPEADSALTALQLASELDPKRGETQRLISLVYRQKGLFHQAEIAARRSVELEPDETENWNQLGSVLVDMEQYGPAELVFYNALKVHPDDPLAIKNLGTLNLYYNYDTSRAAAFLSRYLESEMGLRDQDRLLLRKDLLKALFGQFNPSMEQLIPDTLPFPVYEPRRRQLEARQIQGQESLVQEELGLLFFSRRMEGPAQESFLTAVRLDPSLETAWKMLVILQFREGNYDKTTNTLRAAVRAGVRDPFFLRNLGLFEKYWKMNAKGARIAWESYLERSGDSWVRRVEAEMQL